MFAYPVWRGELELEGGKLPTGVCMSLSVKFTFLWLLALLVKLF